MPGNAKSGPARGSSITPGSAAAARVLEHVARHGLRAVARELELDPGQLSRFLTGARVPRYEVRAAVLARYRIALGAWDEPAPSDAA